MNFIVDGNDHIDYEHIKWDIIDGSFSSISLVISKGKFGVIYDEDLSFNDHYIIMFSSTPYTLQEDVDVDEQLNENVLISLPKK